MQDSTIEHFVKGQHVLYAPATPVSPAILGEEDGSTIVKEEEGTETVAEAEEEDTSKHSDKLGSMDNGESMERDDDEGGSSPQKPVVEATVESKMLEATIIGVHRDDYPNKYYTISIDGTDREKQTVAARLIPRETKQEALDRLAEIIRCRQEEETRRNQEILEEKARQAREAALKRKIEEKANLEQEASKDSRESKEKKGKKNCTVS